MKINFYIKTYKDKILLLPREEISWERTNNVFCDQSWMVTLGFKIKF